ncbi:MAG: MBL fold metallo-hydrolase [Tissierellia bacterium]|nr:MBL fold metallo-hydrolase [Tissierellia bacterium]
MQEVFKNVYTFPVVLPKSPLREINSYVILNGDRHILIDTGYNRPESEEALLDGLKSLGLEPKDVDVVITHLHADHTGLVNIFADAGSKIYAGKVDGDLFNTMATGEYWNLLKSFITLYGIQEGEFVIEDNPGFNFKLSRPVKYEVLEIGSIFKVGDFNFEIVDLKGHTPGHIGLLDREKKILFGADTILDPITPNITFWGNNHENILGTYMDTLRMIREWDLDYVFPSHRKIITNHIERIDTLIHHHYLRMQEILDSMEYDKEYTIRDLSSKITWKIKADSWDDFPKPQKWFATGETMSHADCLVHSGHLQVNDSDGTLMFKKLKDRVVE